MHLLWMITLLKHSASLISVSIEAALHEQLKTSQEKFVIDYQSDAPTAKELRDLNTNWDWMQLIMFGEKALPHIDNLGRLLVERQKEIYVGLGHSFLPYMAQ